MAVMMGYLNKDFTGGTRYGSQSPEVRQSLVYTKTSKWLNTLFFDELGIDWMQILESFVIN